MKFLQTYAKKKTRLSAWISIEDRKKVFDSSASASASEADFSTQRASKPTRIRNIRNAAKKKAPVQLSSEEDEEGIFILPQPLPHKKTARRKPSTACLLPARKRKHRSLSLSSDEENVPPSQNTRKRKSKVYSGKYTRHKTSAHCNDENMCPPEHELGPDQNSVSQAKSFAATAKNSTIQEQTLQENKSLHKESLVRAPSAGRFVTRRRCALSPRPRLLPLNSSDEFSNGRIFLPARRRCPQVFLESSSDSSVSAAVLHSFVTIPLRDISLNDSAEHSLGPCTRKPIFCSTPSAAPLSKTSKHKSVSSSSSPPSISVSCIGPGRTFEADLGSPEQLTSPPQDLPSEPAVAIPATIVESQKHSPSHQKELCDSSPDKTSSRGTAHSPCEEGIHKMPSVLTISSDVSSYFASATGELDWLIDVLKEKCLTQLCTVRLERLEDLIHLFSETTYSSCLGDLGSVYSSNANEHSLSADTSHTSLQKDSSEPSTCSELAMLSNILKSVGRSKSSVQDSLLVSESQHSESSRSNNSSLDLFDESANSCTDNANMQVQDRTEELSTIIKNKCLSRECSVNFKKLPQSSIERHLTPEPNKRESDLSFVHLSQKNSSTVCQSLPGVSETTDKAELTKELKGKCLDSKPLVKTRKMTVTEIKHKLQESVDVSNKNVSELVGDPTEPESNGSTASTEESSFGVGRRRKRTSATSHDRAVSDKNVFETSRNRQRNKSNKISLAPKEKKRRTSTQRPGTTRKACVSGLSVSRWKNKNAFTSITGQRRGTKAVDSSINELIPNHHRQTELVDFSKNFSTPVKGSNLNLSSLLSELTPNAQTWSRFKAALSIHRKVILTPKTPGPGPSSKMAFADISQDLFATPFRTPLPKRLRSQLRTHESQLVFDDEEVSDAEKVYSECGQQCPLRWDECLQPPRMKACVKIGEGTFGEVFSTISEEACEEIVALKVIPVEGSEKVNGEAQKTFGEILHEIIISKELSCLKEKDKNQTSGFIGLKNLHCVKGCYPREFLKAWDKFDKEKHSENDRPDFFEKDQLFIILEFEFGGADLENCNGTLPSIIVAKSILHQVTAALAIAEQELHFEHRDLHWGNVLVKTTEQKTAEFSLNGTMLSLETTGVLVRIIDYSLSRLEIDELTVSCDISQDEELFMGQGDYQFDIYRQMRQENGNDWSTYNPHSNVLWIHYLCSKLLNMKYSRSRCRGNKDMRGKLSSFYDNVLQYSSATEVLQNSPLFH